MVDDYGCCIYVMSLLIQFCSLHRISAPIGIRCYRLLPSLPKLDHTCYTKRHQAKYITLNFEKILDQKLQNCFPMKWWWFDCLHPRVRKCCCYIQIYETNFVVIIFIISNQKKGIEIEIGNHICTNRLQDSFCVLEVIYRPFYVCVRLLEVYQSYNNNITHQTKTENQINISTWYIWIQLSVMYFENWLFDGIALGANKKHPSHPYTHRDQERWNFLLLFAVILLLYWKCRFGREKIATFFAYQW